MGDVIKLKEPYQKVLTPRAICKSLTPLEFYNTLNLTEQQSIQTIIEPQKIGKKIIKAGRVSNMEQEPCLFMYAKPQPSDKGTLYFIIISKDYEMVAFDIKDGNKIKFSGKICYQLVKGNRKVQFALTSGLIMKFTVKKSFEKLGPVIQEFFENPEMPYYIPILTCASELSQYPELFPELKAKILPLLLSPSCDFLIKLQNAKLDPSILIKLAQTFVILAIKHKVISYAINGLINFILQLPGDYSACYSQDSFLGNIMVVVATKQSMEIVRKLITKYISVFAEKDLDSKIKGIAVIAKQVKVHPNTVFVMTILFNKLKDHLNESVATSVIARIFLMALMREARLQKASKEFIEAFNYLLTAESADESLSSILGFVGENFVGNVTLQPKAIGPREVVTAHQLIIKLLVRHGGAIRDAIDSEPLISNGFTVPGAFVEDLIKISNENLEKSSSKKSFASGGLSSKRRSALKRSSGSISHFSASSHCSPPTSIISEKNDQTANPSEIPDVQNSPQSEDTKSSETAGTQAVESVQQEAPASVGATVVEETADAPKHTEEESAGSHGEEESSTMSSGPSSSSSLVDLSSTSNSMDIESSTNLSDTTRAMTSGTWSD